MTSALIHVAQTLGQDSWSCLGVSLLYRDLHASLNWTHLMEGKEGVASPLEDPGRAGLLDRATLSSVYSLAESLKCECLGSMWCSCYTAMAQPQLRNKGRDTAHGPAYLPRPQLSFLIRTGPQWCQRKVKLTQRSELSA